MGVCPVELRRYASAALLLCPPVRCEVVTNPCAFYGRNARQGVQGHIIIFQFITPAERIHTLRHESTPHDYLAGVGGGKCVCVCVCVFVCEEREFKT